MMRRPAMLVALALMAIALGMCSTVRLAYAQVTSVHFVRPNGLTWNSAVGHVCLMGGVRDGAALIVGYSVRNDCPNRIGSAERLGNRQCADDGACLRAWRLTFDGGGVLTLWAREVERRGVLRVELLETRRWRLAFDPLGWA